MVSKSDYTIIKSVGDVIGFLLISIFLIVQNIVKPFLPKSYQTYKEIKGHIVLITGGGGGLGRLLALRFSKLQATVVLWDVNYAGVEETVKLVQKSGGTAYGFKCDLADKDDVYRMAEKTRKEVGDVTILVNNAGVLSGKLLLETPDNLIQRTFDVNILAHFWTVKAFLPRMIEKQNGHIVTIASMAGRVGISKLVDYCSSKYAAVGFDEALRLELESEGVKGVKTTVVCPYFIQSTGMFENVHSRFLPRLKLVDVADAVVEAVQKEELEVILPKTFKVGMVFKSIVPWAVMSMVLRGLVPDAVPVCANSPPKIKLPPKTNNNANSLHSTNHSRGMSAARKMEKVIS